MPHIIPIRDLKNTSVISELCRQSKEPVFITKNGYGDMVIMSMETYESSAFLSTTYNKLEAGERSIANGDVVDAFESLTAIKAKNGL
jgi:PHD/YefM family antitoxin component YafN of YafNO toxin-antitoxin module